ncbi:PQQ-binding-like beta-propeller repeat protein [Sneathiella limimaris]|uniref:outer membrane protein assembly factor BamB family protein n=1 Tax=Sneathiella limimaris TaxID=1964213 RepID=UPI00146CF584
MKKTAASVGKTIILTGLFASLAGCSILPDWFGQSEEPPLPGERISILALEQSLEPDEDLSDVTVRLPAPYQNENWPQSEGNASHAMHHLTMDGPLQEVWRVSVGAGSDDEQRLMAKPVVANGRVFVMDSNSHVRAFEQETGKRLWEVNLTPKEEELGTVGGGLALEYGRLYATTSYGHVWALDPNSGGMYWRKDLRVPLRAAPTVAEGEVFAMTYDSRLYALDARTGDINWDFEGGVEVTGLLGAAKPAVDNGIVIVPFSTGELFALRADTGEQAWSDQLQRKRRYSSLTSLTDINGSPVIDRGIVIAASFSGHMVGIDARTGERKWDQEIATLETPWVAGDFVYTITTDGELVCLTRQTGRIRWVQALGKYEDVEDKTDLIVWSGPILASDRLILVSNSGIGISVSPYDGKILGKIDLSDSATVAPVIAGGMLFILTDDAELVAFR